MRKVKKACRGRLPLVFVDKGPWYPWALKRFKYKYETFGLSGEMVQILEGKN